MIELKAGPELDRTVAVAIGDPRMPTAIIPQYSTDLNAAFAEAEKSGLFGDDGCLRMAIDSKDWVYEDLDHYARATTPALAICTAILAAKDYDFTHGDLDAMGALNPT